MRVDVEVEESFTLRVYDLTREEVRHLRELCQNPFTEGGVDNEDAFTRRVREALFKAASSIGGPRAG